MAHRSVVSGFVLPSLKRQSLRVPTSLSFIGRRAYRTPFRWSDEMIQTDVVPTDLRSNKRPSIDSSSEAADQGINEIDYANGLHPPDNMKSNSTSAATELFQNDTEARELNMNVEKSTPAAEDILALDPHMIDIVVQEFPDPPPEREEEKTADMVRTLPFVNMFRGSANYIANHRNTLALYHIPGDLVDLKDPSVFRDLMNDVALTWLLGMKLVIVVGCRYQVEKRLPVREKHFGMIVTDDESLRIVKEEAGYVRFEVERQLARSLRMQGGAGASQGFYEGNVISGNFYSAQPFGILDGIDFKYSGFVRRVEVEKIRQVHQSRDIVLLSTLGVSPSGEVFNVNSESLAATVAGALDASKVIFFTEKEVELRHKLYGNKIQHLRVKDGHNLLDLRDVKVHKRGFVNSGDDAPTNPTESNMLLKIGWSMHALEQGVKRAHIISPKFGAVLQELYTRDGSGTMISRDLYDGIRPAKVEDVSSIHELISPLIEMGTLVDRPKDVLEKTVDQYHVFTRDDLVVACGQLKMFENGFAEIGCLVVNPQYRARGRGDAMLGYLERIAVQRGASTVFVLSTQTMEWFLERDFDQVNVEALPPTRQEMYNHKRASKIYMKKIDSIRDLDAAELWWNR